jgi:hypothetical protein
MWHFLLLTMRYAIGELESIVNMQVCISLDEAIVRSIDVFLDWTDVLMFVLKHCKQSSTAKTCAIFAYLLLASAMNFLSMNRHRAYFVTAWVQLAMRQSFCILHLPMLECYNSAAPNWYPTLSGWHYQMSARKPSQLWFWWYASMPIGTKKCTSTWV